MAFALKCKKTVHRHIPTVYSLSLSHLSLHYFIIILFRDTADNFCRISNDYYVRRNVLCDNGSGTDNNIITDYNISDYSGISCYIYIISDFRKSSSDSADDNAGTDSEIFSGRLHEHYTE